jgi:hypothetical protein
MFGQLLLNKNKIATVMHSAFGCPNRTSKQALRVIVLPVKACPHMSSTQAALRVIVLPVKA